MSKILKRKIALAAISVLVILGWINHDLLNYAFMQAKGQIEIVWSAQPIADILKDNGTPETIKDKIRLMQEIREFAIDSLGLTNSNNYTTIYDQKGKDVLWNVSASEPFLLESVEWTFPVIGTFSYKGFFDLEKAKEEEMGLKELGYDTRIRSVSAWSTLGWFNDPILSKTLTRGEGSLADLVIHELTHSTIFVTDSLTFNENLASFIGEQGARLFLIHKYGDKSPELKAYLDSETDFRRYTEHMLEGASYLDSIYNSMKVTDQQEKKIEVKEAAIRKVVEHIDTISFKKPDRFQNFFKEKMPNNAYFLAYHRYTSKLGIFEQQLQKNHGGELKDFIAFFKLKYGK